MGATCFSAVNAQTKTTDFDEINLDCSIKNIIETRYVLLWVDQNWTDDNWPLLHPVTDEFARV
jgi:hypothetical protein